jgi:predicted RNA-binding Zn ribbon-like protein
VPARILAPLVGEPLPLDLANTRPADVWGERDADQFASAAGLAEWLNAESDRLPYVPVTESMRVAVVRLRGHVGALLDSLVVGDRPGEGDLGELNAALCAAPGVLRLHWTDAGARLEAVRQGGDEARLLGALAEATAEYLASDLAGRTRQCEAPDCRLLFAATNPRRRWCSPSVCGNRTRVARYYEKHRS